MLTAEDVQALRRSYLETWASLSELLRSGGATPQIPEEYEKQICEAVRGTLCTICQILGTVAKPFRIRRGIVYINSPASRWRVRLPIYGGVDYDSSDWSEWRTYVFQKNEGEERKLLFQEPHKRRHLLTELMWRLRPKGAADHCLALFVKTDALFELCAKSAKIFAFQAARDGASTVWPPAQLKDKPSTDDIASVLGYASAVELWKTLAEVLNERSHTLGDGVEFRGEDYTPEDAERLLTRAMRLLYDVCRTVPASNIFYLSDVGETQYMGAVDVEVVCNSAFSDGHILDRFLHDVQWIISQYVIQPVTSAERDLAGSGEAYCNVFFRAKGLADVRTQLLAQGATHAGTVGHAFRVIAQHLDVAGSPRGRYWRGYRTQAHEVSCCVAEMIELLFPAQVTADFAVRVRSYRPDIPDRYRQIGDEVPFIQGLFRALESEEKLFLVPHYREHFVHSFHVFVLGLLLWSLGPKCIFVPGRFGLVLTENSLRAWFLVAMWHDVAYFLEKMDGVAEASIRRLVGEQYIKRHTGLVPLRPSLGHLMLQVEALSETLNEVRADWESIISLPGDLGKFVTPHDLAVAAAFDRTDHGVWSALMLAHALGAADCHVGDLIQPHTVHELAGAIAPHHIASWELCDLIRKFGVWDGASGKFKLPKQRRDEYRAAAEEIVIDAADNPLGYLLALADLLGQFGREAEEMAGVVPSGTRIQLETLETNYKEHEGTISIGFHYGGAPEPLEDVVEEYYVKPAQRLGLAKTKKQQLGKGQLRISVSGQPGKTASCILQAKG